MNPVTVAIAEDNSLARKSIIKKLKACNDLELKLIATNGEELFHKFSDSPASIILMDIEMPVMDGIMATGKIKEAFPETKVIMLTTFDDDDKIFNAILNGASGYLLKDERAENIHKAIHDVHSGGAAMTPSIACKALEFIRKIQHTDNNNRASENNLSSRELEILSELKNGLPYKQIAHKLFISEGTIRKHVENIYRKLQVNNRMNAVNIALNNKWIS